MRGGSSPKKGGQAAQALGRSRGGFSTKIHVSVDGNPLGNPLPVIHTAADQGYDAQEFRQHILELGMMPVIPPPLEV